MKKIIVVFAAILMANCLFGQTKQESRQMKALENEIQKTKGEIFQLENSLKSDYSDEINELDQHNADLKARIMSESDSLRREGLKDSLLINQKKVAWLSSKSTPVDQAAAQFAIDNKMEKIDNLEKEREIIFYGYTTAASLPKEFSPKELRRRQRAYVIRREELVLGKVERNLSSFAPSSLNNSSNSPATDNGLMVIVDNQCPLFVKFQFSPLDGGERRSIGVDPTKMETIYLTPGKYTVAMYKGGNFTEEHILHINGEKHLYRGKECFGFVYMSRYQ